MEKITILSGQCIPLDLHNVDTDQIIPAQYLTSIEKKGYGSHVFQRLRDENDDFVFNQKMYKNANILIAKKNFGCGSSREHAVWALQEAGIQAIIAISFADIFFNNASKNGLLLITLPEEQVNQWIHEPPSMCTIDLEKQIICDANTKISFDFPYFLKYCFMEGMDELEYLLSHRKKIEQYYQTMKK